MFPVRSEREEGVKAYLYFRPSQANKPKSDTHTHTQQDRVQRLTLVCRFLSQSTSLTSFPQLNLSSSLHWLSALGCRWVDRSSFFLSQLLSPHFLNSSLPCGNSALPVFWFTCVGAWGESGKGTQRSKGASTLTLITLSACPSLDPNSLRAFWFLLLLFLS